VTARVDACDSWRTCDDEGRLRQLDLRPWVPRLLCRSFPWPCTTAVSSSPASSTSSSLSFAVWPFSPLVLYAMHSSLRRAVLFGSNRYLAVAWSGMWLCAESVGLSRSHCWRRSRRSCMTVEFCWRSSLIKPTRSRLRS
jgi:hypothetical protein